MRIREGKIGRQESSAMIGMAVYTVMIFTLDSQAAYGNGNSSYVWLPLSALLSLAVAAALMLSMEKCGINTVDVLLKRAYGRAAGGAACALVIALPVIDACFILADFVDMIHSFVFYDSDCWEITAWLLITVFFLAFTGLECVSRTALITLPVLLAVMAITFMTPMKSFKLYRLSPFPGNTVREMGGLMLANAIRPFGAMAGLLAITDGVHGMRFARNSCIIGSLCAAALVILTQLALALTYTYADLRDMYYPLYRMNMMLVEEGYFFRLDDLLLFFWLAAGMISTAYYVLAASVMWCRSYGPKDTRPCAAALCAVIGCAALVQTEGYYDEFRAAYAAIGKWGWPAAGLPVLAAAVELIKKRAGGKAEA